MHILNIFLYIFFLTLARDFLLTIQTNEPTGQIFKLRSCENCVLFKSCIYKLTFFCNCNCSFRVVSSDHSNFDASILTLKNCIWNFFSYFISNTNNSHKCESLLFNFKNSIDLWLEWNLLIFVDIFESKSNHSKSLWTILPHHLIYFIPHLLVYWSSLSHSIQVMWAATENNLSSSFHMKSLFIISLAFQQSWHLLSLVIEVKSDEVLA